MPFVLLEQEGLLLARLLIEQGAPETALSELERWQTQAHGEGRTRSELEILVLKALAHFTHRDLKAARQSLRAALVLAQPEGYQRLFLDEGEPMAALLQAVLPDLREVPLVTYERTLLRALLSERPGMDTSSLAASAPLLEPLSPQEGRVLRLLAAGHSNPEITRELVVSVNTVKAHVKSIYRKLNVHSRWEAREAARHLKLL